jgi:hypothetical protein
MSPARRKSKAPTDKQKTKRNVAAKPNDKHVSTGKNEIETYNASQATDRQDICKALAREIADGLPRAESKIFHGAPVWFIDGNPIVGYWVRNKDVQLLFWSGQSFDEPALIAEGKFQAAEVRLTDVSQIVAKDLKRWLKKAKAIQWDYKNIVKRRGVLEKIGNW